MILDKKKIVVFSNIVFAASSNRSTQNVVEGFLKRNCDVLYVTAHQHECNYMRQFVEQHKNFEIVYINKKERIAGISASDSSRLGTRLKSKIKSVFRYKKYQSNTDVLEWLGLFGTYGVIKKMGEFVSNNEELLSHFDSYLFIDKFGGMLAQYIRIANPQIWNRIKQKTVGYYLGTVLKQFGNSVIKPFLIMPINFLGSYKVPLDRLIITDDGTDGENIFRNSMGYKKNILFIRNGIDEKLINYQSAKKTNTNSIKLVTCSRLQAWKKVDRAIKFTNYLKDLVNTDVSLTIIGDGEEYDSLYKLVKELGVQNIVTFTGALGYEDALATIDMHDYTIVFNDLSGLGNQIYESIKLGVIPLVIDDGSTDSLLVAGYNSFKFPMCPDFERHAAGLFASEYSIENQKKLRNNLEKTKNELFSWDDRNQIQYEFIFAE